MNGLCDSENSARAHQSQKTLHLTENIFNRRFCKMDDKGIEIDVQLDKKTLNHFLLRNNFLRAGGIFGLLISLAAILALILFWKYFAVAQRVILVFLGLMFTVIQPVTLLLKGWEQLKKGSFREPFHYCFSEQGIEVVNVSGTANVEWKEIHRTVVTKDAFYIYMNTVSAFIIPRSECGDKYIEIAKMLKEHTK
jgi:hypothetical protein